MKNAFRSNATARGVFGRAGPPPSPDTGLPAGCPANTAPDQIPARRGRLLIEAPSQAREQCSPLRRVLSAPARPVRSLGGSVEEDAVSLRADLGKGGHRGRGGVGAEAEPG